MINSLKLKDMQTSVSMWEQMQIEMEYKEDQTSILKRDKIKSDL